MDKFEAELLEVGCNVNEDKEFWETLHGRVIPIYERAKDYEEWKKRWRSVILEYSSIGMEVKVNKVLRNAKGEVVSREPFSTTSHPPGIVIRIK